MMRPRIQPELSAQGIRKAPNPMIMSAWKAAKAAGLAPKSRCLVVDFGCGQLRNVATLLRLARKVLAVDTPRQLETPHNFVGTKMLTNEFAASVWPKRVRVLSVEEFSASRTRADVVFIINVFDVVPKNTRKKMLAVVAGHLERNGALILIAPRNDFWTLELCKSARRYQDGFLFDHPRGHTFYRNWTGSSLAHFVHSRGFSVAKDLSNHRQACLVCRRR